MKKLFLLLLLVSIAFAQNRVAGYFPHWAQYSGFSPADVRYNFLTEIRYGYLTPNGAELLFTDESDKENFIELVKKAKEAKVKIIAAVGGIGAESAIAELSADDLVKAAQAFKKEYGVDGFEIDGGAVDAEGAKKVAELASALSNAGILVSIAVPGDENLASALGSANLEKVDAVSLWFTDQASVNDEKVKPNSNFAENVKILSAFASAGVPRNKLFPIVPFYGRTFYRATGLGSAHEGSGSGNDGVLPYKDILDKFNNTEYKVSFDESTKSEVAVSENETITFNGIPSMKFIAEEVKNNKYGGVAVFDISGDHKEPIVSVLVTIGQVLRPDIEYKKKKK